MSDFIAVIPARYASTRLPGKPLLEIGGKPMIVRVAEQARKSAAKQVWIATDHHGVASTVVAHGFDSVMTSDQHPSGTDRLAEVARHLQLADDTIVVNVQGDEPLIDPQLINAVAEQLAQHPDAPMATAAHPLHSADEMFNPNVVKVVLNARQDAMYFSRAPIPYARDAFAISRDTLPASLPVYRHIGIYAYRAGFLRQYSELSACDLENFEALEQLRVLWHGHAISVHLTHSAPAAGVDTQADLDRVRQVWQQTQP